LGGAAQLVVEGVEGDDVGPRLRIGDEPAGEPAVWIDAADEGVEIVLRRAACRFWVGDRPKQKARRSGGASVASVRLGCQPKIVCCRVIVTSIGIESSMFVRENSMAVRAALALASASASTMPRAIFWFGQMKAQTLMNMMIASHMPAPIRVKLAPPSPTRP